MNPFRLMGDLSHLVSKCILIWHSTSLTPPSAGISFLTQAMYALVFVTRYLDVAMRFVSPYNTMFKVVYIISAFYPNGLAGRRHFTHSGLPFSLLFNYQFNLTEILWSFSIALESVCVIPQLILLRQTTVPTVITSRYLLALGSYRALYIPNWIWRYSYENMVDSIAVVCGIIQTVLYLDFAWVYYSRQRVKLRDGLLVDSEDFQRGWLVRWLGGKDEEVPLEPLGRDGTPIHEEDALEGPIALPPDVELAPADNSKEPPAP
ncbi:ER lumen protein retaining receptor-domain-containing protein [Mycena vulgaris]|nr:ER lumen protein retaining receptor-domain-containing protein [Mycena vulgaris]